MAVIRSLTPNLLGYSSAAPTQARVFSVMVNPRKPQDRFHAVIPAGGVGSRLWPLSRASAPKFLHDLTGSGQTLLQDTWDRIVPISTPKRTMIVTGQAHEQAVKEQLGDLLVENLVIELSPKDSTAAIALAAAILAKREPDVIIGSFAADHVITDDEKFQRAVLEAIELAAKDRIVIIGIEPTEPAVGFGYIKTGSEVAGSATALEVQKFVEKPKLDRAKKYVKSGKYLWNAGMFIAPAALLLRQLKKSEPELHAAILEIAASWDSVDQAAVLKRVWPTLQKVAIDYSVAEPAAEAGLVAVVPGKFSWHDVGDFAAIAELQSQGRKNNLAVLGSARVLADSASGILVSDTNRMVAIIGLEDIIVVDTPDALLVTNKENAQKVKALVDSLKATGHEEIL